MFFKTTINLVTEVGCLIVDIKLQLHNRHMNFSKIFRLYLSISHCHLSKILSHSENVLNMECDMTYDMKYDMTLSTKREAQLTDEYL